MLERLRWWFIKKLVGKRAMGFNLDITGKPIKGESMIVPVGKRIR